MLKLDERHHLVDPIAIENLTVWPIRSEVQLEIGEFLTLQEAQEQELAEVREVGTLPPAQTCEEFAEETTEETTEEAAEEDSHEVEEVRAEPNVADEQEQRAIPFEQMQQLCAGIPGGASVNSLVIENKGELPILVCAGTVVKGGLQDRQIAQDFVIPPRSEVPVDAFCIERGRWAGERAGQATAGKFETLHVVSSKKIRQSAQYTADQSQVWESVQACNAALGKESPTQTFLESIENLDEEERSHREELVRGVREAFAAQPEAVGFAYAVDGEPVGVRLFAHPRILQGQIAAFVHAMAVEADLARRGRGEGADPPRAARAEDILELVRRIDAAEEELRETRAANSNGYRVNEHGGASACYVELPAEAGERIALTRDWTAK